MQLKKSLTEKELNHISGMIDNEGLGYMILYGGLYDAEPENILEKEEDIKKVNEAIKVLQDFAYSIPEL